MEHRFGGLHFGDIPPVVVYLMSNQDADSSVSSDSSSSSGEPSLAARSGSDASGDEK